MSAKKKTATVQQCNHDLDAEQGCTLLRDEDDIFFCFECAGVLVGMPPTLRPRLQWTKAAEASLSAEID